MDDAIISYRRERLRPGLSYPLGQTQIIDALQRAGATTNVSLSCPDSGAGKESQSGLLLRAAWYPKFGGTFGLRRGSPPRTRTWLTIYAVPSDLRRSLAAHLIDRVLPDACAWIKRAADHPDSAWAGSNHHWSAWLQLGQYTVDEV
jgi:hypothetical protein